MQRKKKARRPLPMLNNHFATYIHSTILYHALHVLCKNTPSGTPHTNKSLRRNKQPQQPRRGAVFSFFPPFPPSEGGLGCQRDVNLSRKLLDSMFRFDQHPSI